MCNISRTQNINDLKKNHCRTQNQNDLKKKHYYQKLVDKKMFNFYDNSNCISYKINLFCLLMFIDSIKDSIFG